MKRSLRFLAAAAIFVAGCGSPDTHVVHLHGGVPDDSTSLRWSPAGMRLPLTVSEGDADTAVRLGGADLAPIGLKLSRSGASEYYDRLSVDLDRNGAFDDGPPLETTPREQRGRWWSSFSVTLSVPSVDPGTGAAVDLPYPANFWYVFDPFEPQAEPILRMSRSGWMEGDAVLDGTPVRVLIAESQMDGLFDTEDYWALAEADSAELVYGFRNSRSIATHAWLGEQAYRITALDPSGLRLELSAGDPGITRAEEAAAADKLAVDRNAPRSGRNVAFEPDFEAAEARARDEAKPLFVDFKTTWCGPCFTMDEWVFTADAVVDASTSIVSVKVDGDDRRDLAKRFEVGAYPTLLMLSPGGDELGRFVGYLGVDSTALFMTAPFSGIEGASE